VSAILGFAVKDSVSLRVAYLALVPALVFWGLDGYYLALEKRFRAIYNEGANKLADAGYPQCPKVLPKASIIADRIGFCAWFDAVRELATSLLYLALIICAVLVFLGVLGSSDRELSGV
jgi:hypothetical protein